MKNNTHLSKEILQELQNIVDFVAKIAGVRVGLIMHINKEKIEVLIRNQTKDNPYHVGDNEHWKNSGLYCERVVKMQGKLIVPNALESEEWNQNPDLKLGLIAYLGFPIKDPLGKPFGTLCLLDDKETHFSEDIIKLMDKMASLVEGQLKLDYLAIQNEKQTIEIKEKIKHLNQTNKELEGFFSVALDLLCIANTDGYFLRVNKSWETTLGYSVKSLEGVQFLDFVHPDDKEATMNAISKLDSQEKVLNFTNRYRAKDGTYRFIEWRSYPDGNIIYAAARDITEHMRATEALKKSEEMYRLLTESISDVISVFNVTQMKMEYVSPSVEQMMGYSVEESMMHTPTERMIQSSIKKLTADNEKNIVEFITNPTNPKVYTTEIKQKCKNGDYIWTEMSYKYRYNADEDIEAVISTRNIDDRKKIENQMIFINEHDQLTELHNRRYYEEKLPLLDVNKNYPLTFVMVDVNDLKHMNDNFGHAKGDVLLVTFAGLLKKHFRKNDLIARIGGDEFVVILLKTDAVATDLIIKKLENDMENYEIESIPISASFGHYTKTDADEAFSTVFKKAEDRMYENKKRNNHNASTR